jgi:ribosome-associated protein
MGMLYWLYKPGGCRMQRILTHSVARVRFGNFNGLIDLLKIDHEISIADSEIEFHAIRSQGPGGQNVNKVASAIHLRFDINNSASLSDEVKARLMTLRDRRITADGILNIKAQRSRSQEKNRLDAIKRLRALILKALVRQKARRKTRPSKRSKEKRLADKSKRAWVKRLRRNRED